MNIETLRAIAIVTLVAWCFFWIIRDDLRTRKAERQHRERVRDLLLDNADTESLVADESAIDDGFPWDNIVSVTNAPAFDSITDILAANEANRADWDEPTRWTP